jgi:hypothetical protein
MLSSFSSSHLYGTVNQNWHHFMPLSPAASRVKNTAKEKDKVSN